jgi:CheY-like chemotaxis protein
MTSSSWSVTNSDDSAVALMLCVPRSLLLCSSLLLLLLLQDLQMPKCDGFESTEVIQREFGCCSVPKPLSCIHHAEEIPPDAWCATLPACVAHQRTGPTTAADHVGKGGFACPRPIVIALTANTSNDDRAHCFRSNFDDFCGKPITINDIVTPLKRWGRLILRAKASASVTSHSILEDADDDHSHGSGNGGDSSSRRSSSANSDILSIDTAHKRNAHLSPTAEDDGDAEDILSRSVVHMPTPAQGPFACCFARIPLPMLLQCN